MNTIITLSEKLHEYSPELILNNENNLNLNGIKLFCGNQTFFEPDCIYYGKISELSKLKITEAANFLCIQDTLLPVQSVAGANTNILLLRNDCDFVAIFNFVQDIFNADKRVGSNTEILLDALVYSKGIQHIIEIASEILNNPIVLLDINNLELIAKSQVLETNDVIWDELLTNGGFSPKTLEYIAKVKYKEMTLASKYPFMYLDEMLQHQRIIGNVRINDVSVAAFVVMEHKRKLAESDLDLCSYFCDILSSEMQKNRTHLNFKGASYDTFLSDVLNHKIEDPAVINQRAMNIGLKLKKNLFLLRIIYRIYEKTNFNVIDVRDTAERLLSGSKAFIYDNAVLILIAKENSTFLPNQYFKNFLEYLKSKTLIAGLSNCFHHLHELSLSYEQSKKAIDLGLYLNHAGALYRYKIYQTYHLLEICSKHVDLSDFCNPIVQELIEYDKCKSTEFTKTLYTYLHYSKDTIRTANSLHVHRNTVFYRIEKMKELFKLDFNNGRLTQNIFLSLNIMEMNKTISLPKILPEVKGAV